MEDATYGTDAWWAGLLAGREADPRTLAAYCSAWGVSVSQFYYRRSKAQRCDSDPAPGFREYVLPAAGSQSSGVSLRFGAVQIELAPGFDANTLRAVLACCR